MMIDTTKKLKYSWDSVYADTIKICNWINDVGFKPDLIVGVVRGGAIPAIIASHYLNVSVAMVEWSLRDSKHKGAKELDHIMLRAAHGDRIVFIDDIVDSGATMNEIKSNMPQSNNLLYTSLWYNPSQPTTMHFWVNTINRASDDRWVVFPWESDLHG